MTAIRGKRGEPLLVLAAVLLAWILARAVAWPWPIGSLLELPHSPQLVAQAPASQPGMPARVDLPWQVAPGPENAPLETSAQIAFDPGLARAPARESTISVSGRDEGAEVAPLGLPDFRAPPIRPSVSRPDLPGPGSDRFAPRQEQFPEPKQDAQDSRWSFYGWLYARDDGGLPLTTGAVRPASYGSSQAGLIVRYRLATAGQRRLQIYGRGSKALVAGGEADLAIGLSGRPIGRMPIVIHAEGRVTEVNGATLFRPAVFAASESPPIALTPGLQAEFYGQAGYVGGEFATPFVDAQGRIDHEVLERGTSTLRLGAGMWGGAQDGAARLDIGPSATAKFMVGDVPLKVSVDYRIRTGGNAEPGSGVAVTLSSGF